MPVAGTQLRNFIKITKVQSEQSQTLVTFKAQLVSPAISARM